MRTSHNVIAFPRQSTLKLKARTARTAFVKGRNRIGDGTAAAMPVEEDVPSGGAVDVWPSSVGGMQLLDMCVSEKVAKAVLALLATAGVTPRFNDLD